MEQEQRSICGLLEEADRAGGGPSYSIEVFPPRRDDGVAALMKALKSLALSCGDYRPLFVDVTFNAGGAGGYDVHELIDRTLAVCDMASSAFGGIPACPHLTCRGMSVDHLSQFVVGAQARGIKNFMALRGDAPPTVDDGFGHADELASWLLRLAPGACVSVAGYPETHPEARSPEEDLARLKAKVNTGTHLVVTQFFLDARVYLEFRKRVEDAGALPPGVKMIPGIMVMSTGSEFSRMLKLTGGKLSVPPWLAEQLAVASKAQHNEDRFAEIGYELCCKTCSELYHAGTRVFHLYTLNADGPVTRVIQFLKTLGTSC